MSPLLTEFRALSELATSNSAPQHLSNSASQLSVLVSWESLAEVSKGCKVPCTKTKFFMGISRGWCTPLHPPSTFGLLGLNARKNAQIAPCFRISFRRALDEVRFSTFLIPLMGRLIPDRDQLNPFCVKFLEPENSKVGLREINGVAMESIKSKKNQLLRKPSAKDLDNFSRLFEIFPRISENFREFLRIPGNFREFPRILENFPEFSSISGDFPVVFLKEIASKSPPKPDFRRLRRQKMRKMRFYRHGKTIKNHFFTLWNKVTLKKIPPRIATGLSLNSGTIGAGLECQMLGCWATEPQTDSNPTTLNPSSIHKYQNQ